MVCCRAGTVPGITEPTAIRFIVRTAFTCAGNPMRLYVSGTTRSMAKFLHARDHLGVLLTPKNRNSLDNVVGMGLPWVIDNGAFSGFDPESFRRLLRGAAGRPLLQWIACPDVVADARATLERFDEWSEEVSQAGPVAFVGQDGQEDLELPWDQFSCFFIGGGDTMEVELRCSGPDGGSQAAGEVGPHGKSQQPSADADCLGDGSGFGGRFECLDVRGSVHPAVPGLAPEVSAVARYDLDAQFTDAEIATVLWEKFGWELSPKTIAKARWKAEEKLRVALKGWQ